MPAIINRGFRLEDPPVSCWEWENEALWQRFQGFKMSDMPFDFI